MDSDGIENFDAANEINDAMISSLAEVVKGVSIEEENNPLEDVEEIYQIWVTKQMENSKKWLLMLMNWYLRAKRLTGREIMTMHSRF